MEIGLGVFSGEALPSEGLDQTTVLEQSLGQMELAERVGLDAVWITEHHFLDTGYVGSVLPYAAALAARTTRIGVGISVALAPLYEPIRMAEDAAFVDQLSGGRLQLGLALGYRDVEYEGFGVTRRSRVKRTEEVIEVLRQSWGPGTVEHDGRFYPRSGIEVHPKPARPGGIPILLGGHALPAIDRAARLADGFIMDGGTDSDAFAGSGHNRDLYDRVASGLRLYREARRAHGRDDEPLRFYLTLGGFLHDDGPDAAWAELAEGYMHTRRVYGDWYGLAPEEYADWYPDRMSADEHARRRTEVVLGTPDDVIETMERLREIVGDGLHVMFRCKYPGIADAPTRRSIELLGQVRARLA